MSDNVKTMAAVIEDDRREIAALRAELAETKAALVKHKAESEIVLSAFRRLERDYKFAVECKHQTCVSLASRLEREKEIDSLKAENEELSKMLGKGPYVPLHQYESLKAALEAEKEKAVATAHGWWRLTEERNDLRAALAAAQERIERLRTMADDAEDERDEANARAQKAEEQAELNRQQAESNRHAWEFERDRAQRAEKMLNRFWWIWRNDGRGHGPEVTKDLDALSDEWRALATPPEGKEE